MQKEIYAGENYDLFLSGDDYVIKNKNGASIFFSPRWVSDRSKVRECIAKLSELGERKGQKDLILEQINNTLDIYRESDIMESVSKIPPEVKVEDKIHYDAKIKKRLLTSELNRLARDLSDQYSTVASSDKLYRKIKHLLNESFSSEYSDKILKIFKTDLFRGLMTITEDISPLPVVDRNPALKELCQKVIQSYYDQEEEVFSSFEKKPDSERREFTSSDYVPYRITSDGDKYYLEKKTGGSWKITKKSESATDLQRSLYDLEDKDQERKDKKERIKEEKKELRERKKQESRERKSNKKRSKNWSEY